MDDDAGPPEKASLASASSWAAVFLKLCNDINSFPGCIGTGPVKVLPIKSSGRGPANRGGPFGLWARYAPWGMLDGPLEWREALLELLDGEKLVDGAE